MMAKTRWTWSYRELSVLGRNPDKADKDSAAERLNPSRGQLYTRKKKIEHSNSWLALFTNCINQYLPPQNVDMYVSPTYDQHQTSCSNPDWKGRSTVSLPVSKLGNWACFDCGTLPHSATSMSTTGIGMYIGMSSCSAGEVENFSFVSTWLLDQCAARVNTMTLCACMYLLQPVSQWSHSLLRMYDYAIFKPSIPVHT